MINECDGATIVSVVFGSKLDYFQFPNSERQMIMNTVLQHNVPYIIIIYHIVALFSFDLGGF